MSSRSLRPKKGNTNLKILFVPGITYHESLICCEEFREYEREQVTVPIAPFLDFGGRFLLQVTGHRSQVIALPIQKVSQTLVKANLRPKQKFLDL